MKHRIPVLAVAVALAALAIPLITAVASAAPTTAQPAVFVSATPNPCPTARVVIPGPTQVPSRGTQPGADSVALVTPVPTPCVPPCSNVTSPPLILPGPTAASDFSIIEGVALVAPEPTPCFTPTVPPTVPPTATPAQSEAGQTAVTVTPPPTSTGSNGSSNSSTPVFALLISVAFGGLALAAVAEQRRSIRR